MTLKVLIVDDEPIICKGLEMTVPWHEMGAVVVATANDGEEAIEWMEANETDLILSDVKMPIMDGLQLAEHVSMHFPHSRMVLISGYDEFEYAKRAMKQGVKDYLLKPVDIDELTKLVMMFQQEARETELRTKQKELHDILSSAVLAQEVDRRIAGSRNNNCKSYQIFGSEIKDFRNLLVSNDETDLKGIKNRWKNLMEEKLYREGLFSVSIFSDENRLITCCGGHEERMELSLLQNLLLDVEEELGLELYLGVSPPFHDPSMSREHYTLLIKGMNAHPPVGENVYQARDFLSSQTLEKTYPEHMVEQLKQLSGNDLEMERITDTFFCYVESHRWTLKEVQSYLIEVEKELFEETGDQLAIQLNWKINLTIHNSYCCLKKLFQADLEAYSRYKQSALSKGPNWLMKKAVTYIEDLYQNDLKAAEIANVINVSPNYFSQLIKQETGKHFNDYLHDVRIKHAKNLLIETPYRIFEIAEMVGYKDYKYFVQIFKKLTGVTPTQYRRMNAHRGNDAISPTLLEEKDG